MKVFMANTKKGREGAGNRNSKDVQRRQEEKIVSLLRGQMLEEIEENDDYFKNLSDGTKQTLTAHIVPKAKPYDEDLQASALSLTASLSHLPEIDDISKENYILRQEMFHLKSTMQAKQKSVRTIKKYSKDADEKALITDFLVVLKDVQHNADCYYERRKVKLYDEDDKKMAVEKCVKR